ncbi:MAG TPA: glycosyltransferase [Terracidiphilus sp.]|jgi:glycosyltransferase involved in cell wall biosynthesis
MKLLHIISLTDSESGGPIEALLRISEVLIRDGHQVAVASLEDEEEVARRKFPFPIAGLGRGTKPYSYNPHLAPWLRENACNFDVVVLHGLWNYSSLGSWRGLRNGSTPYYIFAHGMMDPWFRDRYPLKHIAKQAFWTLAEGRVLRDAQSVLFTCEEERMRARGVFKGHPYRERVVLLGTADPDGDPAIQRAAFESALPALNGRRFLLYISRIHPKKGCDLLINAFAEVAQELAHDLQLVIAGPDQVGWVPELQQLAESLGIAARIHWPGMLKGDAKWGAFRSADAMILPSHQENFGFVVAEAMACSSPVLISDKVNIWREVQASGCGLVEPDTLEGTRCLIRRFYAQSHADREQMAHKARAGFMRYFDIEGTAHAFARAIGFESEPAPTTSDPGGA